MSKISQIRNLQLIYYSAAQVFTKTKKAERVHHKLV